MNKTSVKIGYIDDDIGAKDGYYETIQESFDEYSSLDDSKYVLECKFILVNREYTPDSFLGEIAKYGLHGLIIDYDLVQSSIFENARDIWKMIKGQNALFPTVIITSHDINSIQMGRDSEKYYEKSDSKESYNEVRDYLVSQISRNFDVKEAHERVAKEISDSEGISHNLLNNEIKQEGIFSVSKNEYETKFNELIDKAIEIIDKYSEASEDDD